jgi:hypothetical protein
VLPVTEAILHKRSLYLDLCVCVCVCVCMCARAHQIEGITTQRSGCREGGGEREGGKGGQRESRQRDGEGERARAREIDENCR